MDLAVDFSRGSLSAPEPTFNRYQSRPKEWVTVFRQLLPGTEKRRVLAPVTSSHHGQHTPESRGWGGAEYRQFRSRTKLHNESVVNYNPANLGLLTITSQLISLRLKSRAEISWNNCGSK